MALTREEVIHIAALCRINLTEEDVERLRHQLSSILENFEVLKQIDTADVPPTGHSVNVQNVMRDDEPKASLHKEDILSNAPQQEEGLFRVLAVLEES